MNRELNQELNRNLLNGILTAYGASGSEAPVRAVIESALYGHVDSLTTDAMGNLIAVRHGDGTGKRIMISSHMDHIGLAVVDADEHGFLRICEVGGVDPSQILCAHVVFANGVEGIVNAQPSDGKPLRLDDLYIDIGAESREDALARVDIGDACVMKPDISALGPNRLASPAMDDRIACYIQTEAMLALPPNLKNEVVAVFSVQEEVGCRGAQTAAYAVHPDLGIAIDVTPTGDTPKAEPVLPVKLGGGAAVKIMDSGTICSPAVVRMMLDQARINGIPVQREVLPYGGTDAEAIQRTHGGVPAGAISVPCRYVHTAAETVDLRDVKAALDLLLACLEK